MLTVVKQNFEQKFNMYSKCRDKDIISMLQTRDSMMSLEDFKDLMNYLYENISREELVSFIARRDFFELCKEQ